MAPAAPDAELLELVEFLDSHRPDVRENEREWWSGEESGDDSRRPTTPPSLPSSSFSRSASPL
jgi:hypothetical protein